jgi:tetratricopeptide (TPR) repeat protein
MLQLARFVGDQGRQTLARAWLGILKAAAGDYDTAIENGKDALALALSHGDRRSELYAHLALADAYIGQGERHSEARYHASQAMAVATSQRQDRHEIECRLRFAHLASQTRDYDDQREAASRALALAMRLGARHLEALARCWLASALLHARRETTAKVAPHEAARIEADAALRISSEIGLQEGIWRANAALADICAAAGDAEGQEAHARAAVAALEQVRRTLAESDLADTLLESGEYLEVYERLGEILRLNGRRDELATYLDQIAWPPLTERLERRDGAAGS